jgi:hypothetical protein
LPADIWGLIGGPASTGSQYDGDEMLSAESLYRDAFTRVALVPCYADADWGIRGGAQRRNVPSSGATTSHVAYHTIQTCPRASALPGLRTKIMASVHQAGAEKTAAAGFQLNTLGSYHHEHLKT